jgi:hypothetical protein
MSKVEMFLIKKHGIELAKISVLIPTRYYQLKIQTQIHEFELGFGMESIPHTGFLRQIPLRLMPCIIKLMHINL